MGSIYDLKIDFHQGGQSEEETWSIEGYVWTGLLFTRANVTEHIDDLTDKFLPILRPDVRIKNVTMSLNKGRGTLKGDDAEFLTFGINKQGTRVAPVGGKPSRLALGLSIRKDSDETGYPGNWLIRGTLYDKDVKVGNDGFEVQADTFDDTLVQAFCTAMDYDADAAFRIVLPAKKGKDWEDASRNIYDWVFLGIGEQAVRNNRRTKKQNEEAVAGQEITPVFKSIREHYSDGIGIDDILALPGMITTIEQLIVKFGIRLVQKYGLKVLGKVLYLILKGKVPSLPALPPKI